MTKKSTKKQTKKQEEQKGQEEIQEEQPKIYWHDWLGEMFKVLLIPTGLDVQTKYTLLNKLPEADLVIVRKETKTWTKDQLEFLPDGIRHTNAKHVLIELKFTESIDDDALLQIGGYRRFYRNTENKKREKESKKKEKNKKEEKIKPKDLQTFLICSQTPRKTTLQKYGYEPGDFEGVYTSHYPLCELFPLISLNDLSDEPHNVMFKLFASKKKEHIKAQKKIKSEEIKEKLTSETVSFITNLFNVLLTNKEGSEEMDYLNLTPKEKENLMTGWVDNVVASFGANLILKRIPKEEVFANYSQEDVFSNYSMEDIEAYIKKTKKKKSA